MNEHHQSADRETVTRKEEEEEVPPRFVLVTERVCRGKEKKKTRAAKRVVSVPACLRAYVRSTYMRVCVCVECMYVFMGVNDL